jgi:hypothetical protein
MPSTPSTLPKGRPDNRFARLPSPREMGLTYAQHAALTKIRRLEAEVIETLSYHTIADNAVRISEIERLIETHFPSDLERLQAKRQLAFEPAAATVAAEERALAS